MEKANRYAFKEWAAVCAAMDRGTQSLILRKGGIHEGTDGFRVDHREFWMFPTRFHQAADELSEEAQPLLEEVTSNVPTAGTVRISNYAVVDEVIKIEDESVLPYLDGLHILSARTLSTRFHYRIPGLFALLVRVFRLNAPLEIPDSPHFAGCRSWIDLPDALSTAGMQPVLSDEQSQDQIGELRRALCSRNVGS